LERGVLPPPLRGRAGVGVGRCKRGGVETSKQRNSRPTSKPSPESLWASRFAMSAAKLSAGAWLTSSPRRVGRWAFRASGRPRRRSHSGRGFHNIACRVSTASGPAFSFPEPTVTIASASTHSEKSNLPPGSAESASTTTENGPAPTSWPTSARISPSGLARLHALSKTCRTRAERVRSSHACAAGASDKARRRWGRLRASP